MKIKYALSVFLGIVCCVASCSSPEQTGAGKSDGFLLFAGVPNNEPIVRGGPFVMNTLEEIHQAFEDYRKGVLHI